MSMNIGRIALVVLDSLFDITSNLLGNPASGIGKTTVSTKFGKTSSIDERIAKIDEAKTSLLEGVRLIDELREAAENNKKEAALAIAQVNKLETDKVSIQQELDSIRKIAQADVETFRKMAGVPSTADIRRERIIGFVSGVVSSLIASGVIWVAVWLFGYFF